MYEDLRALTRTREAFVADRQATAQRLEELSRMPMDKKTARTLQTSYKRILKELDRAIDQTEAAMMKLIAAHPQLQEDLKLGDSLPGMGPITVATILAEAGDLRLFTPQELTAFAGLDPVTRQSGTSVHSPKRMTRRGNTRIRRVLANAAWASTRTKADNPFKTAFRNLQTRNKPPLVALNAVMRKMLITLRAALIAGKYSPICAPPQPVGKL